MKSVDFVNNLGHIMLGWGLQLDGSTAVLHMRDVCYLAFVFPDASDSALMLTLCALQMLVLLLLLLFNKYVSKIIYSQRLKTKSH